MVREGGRETVDRVGTRIKSKYLEHEVTIEVEIDSMDDAKKILQGNIEELSLAYDFDKDPEWDSQRSTLFWDARLNKGTIDG